ncbi:triose-phosphate isomerase [Enterobacteriaceae endosymbiont of Donacia bicoloricornis]|uniref:triose-phosphate isomerase n=1 Tax=Enterobacteriaceae endosymbiont of Donacia bicoloricornis TaxID=2675772 RepID=UPI0014492EBB|nr:triose-phosphate isomerase [Enterobacteriaceae endosymbiont of Donacia bicoloricornis]QJC37721.1 triose-phosphate isomerase [Enterobacteriaceae endosymbiont of Donacia bicoloricornis]
MTKFLIIANWKLNGNYKFINKNINLIKKKIYKSLYFCNLSIAPPYIYLGYINNLLKNTSISLTAQNVDIHTKGSFTGEISIKMLKDVGVKYVIIGHSERRFFHNENNDIISKKFILIKNNGLIPILCLGETEKQKKRNETEKICIQQINSILENSNINILNKTIIAYEPIWAIGSGKNANINEIQKTILFIKKYISSLNSEIVKNIYFLYGGSVNVSNLDIFLQEKTINGLLIGKASLTIENFISLVKKAEKTINSFNSS